MGERYLIDTSAYSYYITRRLAAEPYLFFERIVGQESLLSVVTRIELLSWIPGNKVVEAVVRSIVNDSIVVPLSEEVILQTVRLRRHHKSVKLPDAIIAATAMVHDFTLLSTNDSDFEKIQGLKCQSLNA
ncbi:MAG: type II toxin-antitoxin system VapC family toxin [Rudanella sp.]|nr:type II toxin-antitoxin system VapC family toxin [Rudanella sp.]